MNSFEPRPSFGELPYDLEAEQSVLGAVIIDPQRLNTVMEQVRSDYFFRETHKKIYAEMSRMLAAGEGIDTITLLDALSRADVFATREEGKVYLAQLVETTPPAANLAAYVEIIRRHYFRRSLITAFEEIISGARSDDVDAEALMDRAEQLIYEIRQGKDVTGLEHVREILPRVMTRLLELSGADRSKYLGVSSGFSGLDALIGGLRRSDLIILAARPGMGKTSLALNIASHLLIREKRRVAIFSLEMSKEQLVMRILSSEALISSEKLQQGNLSSGEGQDWANLRTVAEAIAHAELYIDEAGGITVAEMKAKLRRLRGADLVIVDYLQLMSAPNQRGGNRVQEISEITRNMKIMAKELDVPVILLSQLSRGGQGKDSTTDARPKLYHLRDSGSIEQDADVVLMLYSDAYKESVRPPNYIVECNLEKNRHGPTGQVKLMWTGEYTRFTPLETEYVE